MTRKLDALVAERVLEWEGIVFETEPHPLGPGDVWGYSPDKSGPRCVPNFDEWYACGLVIEKMEAEGWLLMTCGELNSHHASFVKDQSMSSFNKLESKTMPVSICLAALRAKGVSEDDIREAMKGEEG